MANKNTNSKSILFYTLLVSGIIVSILLWTKVWIFKQNKSYFNTENTTFVTFTSKKLGVEFEHDPRLIIMEKGNKIVIDDTDPTEIYPHYVIEVFNKSKSTTLEQAINTALLNKYHRAKCYAKRIDRGNPTHPGYLMAVVTYPSNRNPQDENNLPKCNPDYYETNGARIFWMDPENSNKFVFISAGQSVIYSTGDINWPAFKILP